MNKTFSKNKLALITGASQRIGKALTEHLAGKGWNIAIHYNRSETTALALADQLREKYPEQKFETFKADFGIFAETQNLIPTVCAQMGIPELLINNASVFEPATISGTSPELFDLHMTVNFKVPFFLIRNFAMVSDHGQVISLTDTRITNNKNAYASYSLSKKALWELTKMAALEFGPKTRVNAIAPGLTLPPLGKDEVYLEILAANIPLKRPGGLEPVLRSLDFLLENEYLTGQLIFCDGGQNLL
jgi:pteridine reductase